MKEWWREKDYSELLQEKRISIEMQEIDIVDAILKAVTADTADNRRGTNV